MLYAATLYPGVGGRINPGDSIKFQYIGKILGVPHEPGYPQYVLLNFLWTSLPWPFEPAVQINLLSAVFSLLAGGIFWRALDRLTDRPLVAALGALTLLLSLSVWTFSTEAEVHSLQLVWACLAFWLAVRWTQRRDRRWLIALLAAVALSFGNHPLAVMLLLGTVALVLIGEPRAALSPSVVGAGLLFAYIGVSQYGFLLLRSWSDAPYVEAVPHQAGLADLWHGMVGQRFIEWHWMKDATIGVQNGWVDLLLAAVIQLSLPALALAVLGAVVAVRRHLPVAAFLLAVLGGSLAFYVAYHVPDPQPYQAHVWLPLAALAAVGAAALPQGWRLGACLLWAGFLVVNVQRDAGDLRVDEAHFDRSRLVAQAPAHTTVLFEQDGEHLYPIEQLANYYTYAFPDKRPGVEARAAAAAFENGDYLRRQPLVFVAADIREELERQRIAWRPLGRTDREGRQIFVTHVVPARRLELVSKSVGLEMRRGDAPPLVASAPGVSAVVLDPETPGVRAVIEVPWTSTPSTERRIWEILRSVRESDTLCVVVQGEGDRVRRLVERLAPEHVGEEEELHSAVLVANLEASPYWLQVLINPERERLPVGRWRGESL